MNWRDMYYVIIWTGSFARQNTNIFSTATDAKINMDSPTVYSHFNLRNSTKSTTLNTIEIRISYP